MKKILGLILSSGLALTGCTPDTGFVAAPSLSQSNSPNGPGGNPGVKFVDQFTVPAAGSNAKIDVLFVVDNSGSMAEEQTIIGNSFSSFISQFTQQNADFHLGVITTDVDSSPSKYISSLAGFVNPTGPGNLLTRYAGEPYLVNSTPNLLSKFPMNAKVGTTGSGREQGLNSLGYFLEPSKLAAGGANAGFIREDALLSVIFVTDEDESEAVASGETIDGRIGRIVNRINVVKGSASRGFRFDFIISSSAVKPAGYPAPSDPIPLVMSGTNPYPGVYRRAAELTGSQIVNIATNFAPDLANLGGSIVTQGQSEFKLSAKPLASSLVVVLDGIAVPADAANGYVLHAERNTIELKGAALARAPGKVLNVDYSISVL